MALEDKCIELTRQTTYKNVTGINAMKTKSLSASKPLLDELHSVFVHVNVSIVQVEQGIQEFQGVHASFLEIPQHVIQRPVYIPRPGMFPVDPMCNIQ